MDGKTTCTQRVDALLQALPDLKQIDQDSVSCALGLAAEELQHKLAEEHSRFAELLDSVRRDRALRALHGSDQSIDAIATELGFADRSAFESRFYGWYQTTPAKLRSEVSEGRLADLLQGQSDDDWIPPAPQSYQALLALDEADDAPLQHLAEVIARDPVLASKLVGMAGSAFYGARTVNSVRDAVTILGLNEVRRVATFLALQSALTPIGSAHFDPQHFWALSLAMSQLAPRCVPLKAGDDEQRWALLGLMAELGSLLQACQQPDQLETHLAALTVDTSEWQIRESERAHLGATRYRVGAIVLARWGLAPDFVRDLRALDEAADSPAECRRDALRLLLLSRALRHRLSGWPMDSSLAALQALGVQAELSPQQLTEQIDAALQRGRAQIDQMPRA